MAEDMGTEVPNGMDRREFVKRSAIVGGLVWAAPSLTALAPRAFAGEHGTEERVCVDYKRVKWEWTNGGFVSDSGTSVPFCESVFGSSFADATFKGDLLGDPKNWIVTYNNDGEPTSVKAKLAPDCEADTAMAAEKGGTACESARADSDGYLVFDGLTKAISYIAVVVCCFPEMQM